MRHCPVVAPSAADKRDAVFVAVAVKWIVVVVCLIVVVVELL